MESEIESPLRLDDFAGTNSRAARAMVRLISAFRNWSKDSAPARTTIPEQHAERIPPPRIDRGLRAPAFRFIHDVVVDERSDVDQFDDHRQIEMPGRHSAAGPAAQQRHDGPEPFPAAADRIGDVTLDGRIKGGRLLGDAGFHFLQLGSHPENYASQSAVPRGRRGGELQKLHNATIGGATLQRKLRAESVTFWPPSRRRLFVVAEAALWRRFLREKNSEIEQQLDRARGGKNRSRSVSGGWSKNYFAFSEGLFFGGHTEKDLTFAIPLPGPEAATWDLPKSSLRRKRLRVPKSRRRYNRLGVPR